MVVGEDILLVLCRFFGGSDGVGSNMRLVAVEGYGNAMGYPFVVGWDCSYVSVEYGHERQIVRVSSLRGQPSR